MNSADTATARTLAATTALGLVLMVCGPAVADTLLTNGVIFTANKAAPMADAVGIRVEKIIAVGARAEVEAQLAAGFDTVDLLKPYLDPSLCAKLYLARSIRDAGGIFAGATDWPVDVASPFLEMAVGIARSDGSHPPFIADQTLTNEDMLYAFTINAAKAARIADVAGSIEVGKSADFALVDQNLLTADPDAITETQVLWTMFEGRKVYELPK